MFVRRLLTIVATAVTALALAAGPASAHFCFKTHFNEASAAGKVGSNGWASFGELAFEFTGLCPAGIAILAEAADVTVGTPIKTSGVMAGGTLKKEDGGNKAIDHLDFEAIDAAFPAAAEACA